MAEPRMEVNGNHYPCPICKMDPDSCSDSLTQMNERVWEDRIRKIVREELKRLDKTRLYAVK